MLEAIAVATPVGVLDVTPETAVAAEATTAFVVAAPMATSGVVEAGRPSDELLMASNTMPPTSATAPTTPGKTQDRFCIGTSTVLP